MDEGVRNVESGRLPVSECCLFGDGSCDVGAPQVILLEESFEKGDSGESDEGEE